MNQNPNNRRRRLTADELIAILIAFASLGTVFWWSITHRSAPVVNALLNNGERVAGETGITQTFPLVDPTATVRPAPVPTKSAMVKSPAVVKSPAKDSKDLLDAAPTAVVAGTAAVLTAPSVALAQPTSSTPAFQDVPDQYWGKDYITVLKERGVLDDFGDGKFDPNAPITRGEYAKMLDRAFDRPVSQQVLEFKDIPDTYARRAALDKAVKMGFMTGYSPSKFAPDEKIPRFQMQISLAKGLNLPATGDEAALAKYADANALPKYARPKMGAAIAAGLVVKDGENTKLQPVKAATRGEAAALIHEALVKDGKIPAGK